MSGRLRLAAIEQPFAFPQPVRARFAQLRIKSNQQGSRNGRSTLAEWKVIGTPGEHPLANPAFNLADPILGGHVVWSRPIFGAPSDAILNEAVHTQGMKLDPAHANDWVVGFRYNRAAQINKLEWVQPAPERNTRTLSKVEVSVSTESPNGPWTPIGSWKITPKPGSSTTLDLTQPVWARFVRFSTTEPKKAGEYWKLPESIRIYERGADATYRSVLGEWGHYARPAIYERLVTAPAAGKSEEITGNGKLGDAKRIEIGKGYRGRVVVGEDEDWYQIEVPKDHNKLSVSLEGDPMLRAVASLQDESGKIIPTKSSPGAAGITQVDATVEGGKKYLLRLSEPPRSIALVWDNSPSIRNYATQMYRALMRIVEAVQPKREFVNLLPFSDDAKPRFLLSSWSDQSSVLRAGIQNYDRGDASSDVETSLLAATEELGKRDGSKAIFLLTDALSPGYMRTAELWDAFSRVPVRVFSVELQLGNLADPQQRMMQDLADANAGHYTTFRSGDQMDAAFDRASCYLRRPAHYTMSAATIFEVPPPPASIESLLAKSGRVDVYGIYFDVGSAVLKAESGPVLKEISDALAKNPAWKLSVEGHTDNAGGDAPNMVLSRNRAAAVKLALSSRFGIAAERLATSGFGASRPKEPNSTTRGRALNRRVELVRQ
jgi:outer membrane protein OmpA-like peptidoglycan-associated protein